LTLLVEKGTFTKTTSTAAPVDQTVNLVDSGLTPKAIILWSNGLTTTDGTYAENYEFTYGFSDGTNDVCQRTTVEDNDTAAVASYSFNNNCVISMCNTTTPTAGTETSRGDLLSFGAGNFHINWSTQSDTTAKVIHYIVIGGSDIENVSVFSTTVGDTSTGNHSFNGSGTTFTPNFALTQTGSDAYVTLNSLEATNSREQICIGAAKSTTEEYCVAVRSEDAAANADCDQYLKSDACLMTLENAAGADNFVADFVSFNSAAGGGITVNVSNAAGASTQIVAFMLIKSSASTLWDVGTFAQRSGTGTQDVTLDDAFDPQLVFLSGINSATAGSRQDNNYFAMGASDGTREGVAWCGDQNGAGTMINTRRNLTTKVYTQATPAATAGSSTTNAEADMSDMATFNKFTLDWTTASATLHQIGFWAVGRNTRVDKTLTLKWNIVGRILKNTILKWNIQERISKALSLKWNIEQRISKDLILKWDIQAGLERITKDVILKWNIIGRITKNLILKWNIIQFITKSLVLKWNIIGRISKDLILKWNIIGRISKALILKWNIIGRISKALTLKWNIQQHIDKLLTLKWNIQNFITKNLTLKWNIQQRISKELILKWNIIGRISKAVILKWNIIGRITKDTILKWNIIGRISKNLILKWDIMEAGLERITKDIILKWNMIGRISKPLTLKWNIQNFITKNLTLKWNIQQRVFKALTLKWNIQQRISKALTLKWNIEQRILKTLTLKWNIQSSLERITKNIILKWNIVGRVTKNLTLKWNIQVIAATITERLTSITGRTEGRNQKSRPFDSWRDHFYRPKKQINRKSSRFRRG
jgi:hypothetical protein